MRLDQIFHVADGAGESLVRTRNSNRPDYGRSACHQDPYERSAKPTPVRLKFADFLEYIREQLVGSG
jgi:hypothetical protein